MKSWSKSVAAVLLAAAPIAATVGTAFANTELVPASRLAIPYWDISGSRTTLILLTNASESVDLRTVGPATPKLGVHIEFYDKTCDRTDKTIDLSKGDIDQLDLRVKPSLVGDGNLPSQLGFADIDVRHAPADTDSTGVECNVLMGTVVIGDDAGNFAVAYPAASSLGSSGVEDGKATCDNGGGANIVTREIDGTAAGWTGSYEPFPARVFVPMYFAEGGPVSTTSTLAIASVADGNWDGLGSGEAPGQDLNPFFEPDGNPILIKSTTQFWDGCENKESPGIKGHMIFGSLTGLFGNRANQSLLPWKTSTSCSGNFASIDEYSGAFVGWIDIPNTVVPTDAGNGAGTGVKQIRNLVGVLIQSDTANGGQGDATRLWGDPEYGSRNGNYSYVDDLDFGDL